NRSGTRKEELLTTQEELQKEKMASVSSGMQLPPGFKMPF
ncbi:hypothetical protein ACUOA5_36095, partial [Escherichia coli]